MELCQFKDRVLTLSRDIEEHVCHLFRPICEETGLTPIQIRVLMELRKETSFTVSALSQRVGMACGNLSNLCKKLDQNGYLNRRRSAEDERVVTLTLTPQGENTIQNIDRRLEDSLQPAFDAAGSEQLERIITGLEQIDDLLQKGSHLPVK